MAVTTIYTLSLHDALPISRRAGARAAMAAIHRTGDPAAARGRTRRGDRVGRSAAERSLHRRSHDVDEDRKSTRLNSSHSQISYAVFCLKKKNFVIIVDFFY